MGVIAIVKSAPVGTDLESAIRLPSGGVIARDSRVKRLPSGAVGQTAYLACDLSLYSQVCSCLTA